MTRPGVLRGVRWPLLAAILLASTTGGFVHASSESVHVDALDWIDGRPRSGAWTGIAASVVNPTSADPGPFVVRFRLDGEEVGEQEIRVPPGTRTEAASMLLRAPDAPAEAEVLVLAPDGATVARKTATLEVVADGVVSLDVRIAFEPPEPRAGDRVRVVALVENIVDHSIADVEARLEAVRVQVDDVHEWQIATNRTHRLEPGAVLRVERDWRAWPGTHAFVAWVDDHDVEVQGSVLVPVPEPPPDGDGRADLVVRRAAMVNVVLGHYPYTDAVVEVANDGEGEAGRYTVLFLDDAGNVVSHEEGGPLAPGASEEITTRTLLRQGDRSLTVFLDAYDEVREADEAGNVAVTDEIDLPALGLTAVLAAALVARATARRKVAVASMPPPARPQR